jgi:DUF971 family protein
MGEIKPKSITAMRKSAVLTIEWNDGQRCDYPFSLLRNACPCAQCRGGHENMSPEPAEDVFTIPLIAAETIRLKTVEAVGNYAINIEWEDGHKYGIYEWRFLRILCERMQQAKQK